MKKIRNILLIVGITIFLSIAGIKASETLSSNQVSYQNKTVQSALDELMEVADNCPKDALCSKVSIGDYVQMTPTQTLYTIPASITGYSLDQTINPNELNLWRVISINPDGTIDMVSEYLSSQYVFFEGLEGYLNLVETLNLIANQYGNSAYTIRMRHMGYNGQTTTITNTSNFTETAPWALSTSDNSNEIYGGGDILYENDTNLVKVALGTLTANKVGETTNDTYWLASRRYSYISDIYYAWGARNVHIDNNVSNSYLHYYDNMWISRSDRHAIRPIVTLKAEIKATGSGTGDSPWILN